MAAIINTNIQSMNAQRNLSKSQSTLSTSMQRLSSGLRINSAKDDAAGLAISERMTTQTRGLTVAARNANDGISLAQTAEGALGSLTANLQRIRELAVQSRNATNSTEDRAALNEEVQQLKDEINRVARDTSFNGTKLLDGSFTNMAFQVGANQGQTIDITSIVNANSDALGSWNSLDIQAVVTSKTAVQPKTVVPTTQAMTAFTPNTTDGPQSWVIEGITVASNTVAMPGTPGLTALQIDQNLAANADALREKGVVVTGSVAGNNLVLKKIDGTTLTQTNTDMGLTLGAAVPGTPAYPAMTFTIAAGTGTAQTINVAATTSAKEFGEKVLEAINASAPLQGKVQASFAGGKLTLTGINEDITVGGTDIEKLGMDAGITKFRPGTAETGFEQLTVETAEDSDNAILAMDAALAAVNSARATLGAVQSRFQTTIDNLNITNENLTASKSRIMDADFAAETAALSAAQVLQQAGTAMVAQANQVPQTVLQLLQG